MKQSPNPLWNGLMHIISKNTSHFDTRGVPFINMPASNLNTIYFALIYAFDESRKYWQQTCIVTFDQSLYWKVMEIVAAADNNSKLANVVVKLGGFHLRMSYLGAIAHIMSGHNIEELWALIYEKNIVVHIILNGNTYARSHFLTYVALHPQLLRDHEIIEEEKSCKAAHC